MWDRFDLSNILTVPCASGKDHTVCLPLAFVLILGHPRCSWSHQNLPDTEGESNFKEGTHMDPFFSQQSSSSLTMKGISSWFWEAFSLQQRSMLCLLCSLVIWSKQVLTLFNIQLHTLVFQERLHCWHFSWVLRAQIPT